MKFEGNMLKMKATDNVPVTYYLLLGQHEIAEIQYPLQYIPDKLTSIDLEKVDTISDILTGIKGQYLIFKSGKIINIRKHNGYKIELAY